MPDNDEDLGCLPMPAENAMLTSTPKKKGNQQHLEAGKHELTPDSKRQNEPPSKRVMLTESPSSTAGRFLLSYYKQYKCSMIQALTVPIQSFYPKSNVQVAGCRTIVFGILVPQKLSFLDEIARLYW